MKELERKLLTTLLSSLREGLAATRIAEFIRNKLQQHGKNIQPPGAVLMIDTGEQCSVAGTGALFEAFLQSGQLENYTGYGQDPKAFYDKNFETALYRRFNFDQTFYRQPYDARSRKIYLYYPSYKYRYPLKAIKHSCHKG